MNQYDPIRKNLREFSVPIDKEKLWANTSHAIPKKRKRRGVFFWLLGAAILTGSAILYNTFTPSTSSVAENEINTSTPAHTTSPVTNETNNSKNLNASVTPETPLSAPQSLPDPRSAKTKVNGTSTHRSASETKTTLKTVNNSENANTSSVTNLIGSSQHEMDRMTIDPSSLEIPTNTTNGYMDAAETLIEVASAGIPISQPSTEPAKTDEISTLPIDALDILSRELTMSDPAKVPVKKKNNFTISLMQGYGWSSMDMSTNSAEWEPVITEWQGKIKSLENIETNIEATIRLPKGIQLGAGLQYSLLTTQLDYQQTISEDITEQGIIAIIIDEDDSHHNLYGDVQVNRQTIVQSTRFTKHQRLNLEGIVSVPVFRSYRMETGIWVKAGYNLLYTSEGTTFSPNGEPLKFSSKDNPYTLQSPFTFAAGIGTLYRINTHWIFVAKAGYEPLRYTHGLFNDQIVFHHSIFSLSMGAGYTF